MVKAFCEYWGISEKDVRSVGRKFDTTMQELLASLDTAKTAEEKAVVEAKIADLAKEFSYMYHMVYMTAASYGIVSQKRTKNARRRSNVAVAA